MSEMIVEIREAKEADLSGILGLYSQPGYDDGKVLPTEQARAIFMRARFYPFYRFYVAVAENLIVGTYALLVMENMGHLGTPSAVVESVAVAPDWQGRGVGARMMAHALDQARSQGCYKLALSSNLKRVDAHRFYEKLGFLQHGMSFVVPVEARHEA